MGRSVVRGIGLVDPYPRLSPRAASGWIGTTAPQTAVLDGVIREILETGRTVTIASKRDLKRREQSRRAEREELAWEAEEEF